MNKTLLLAAIALPFASRAQSTVPPADEQIAAAILPLPADLRAGAKVLGYRAANKLEVLRDGKNGIICLALYVTRPDFHVACYHDGLEPFMARGRALRDSGVTGDKVDTVRFREIKSGKLKMPAQGMLYELFAKKTDWNAATRKLSNANALTVLYVPFATAATTGLSTAPTDNGPWLMLPGTPKAHIMIAGKMSM